MHRSTGMTHLHKSWNKIVWDAHDQCRYCLSLPMCVGSSLNAVLLTWNLQTLLYHKLQNIVKTTAHRHCRAWSAQTQCQAKKIMLPWHSARCMNTILLPCVLHPDVCLPATCVSAIWRMQQYEECLLIWRASCLHKIYQQICSSPPTQDWEAD